MLAAAASVLWTVNDGQLWGLRILAHARLMRMWASGRFDDFLGYRAGSLERFSSHYALAFERTKTSGVGSHAEDFLAFIDDECFLVHSRWMERGLELLEERGVLPDRDFWVPQLLADGETPLSHPMPYGQSLAWQRHVLTALRTPSMN